jgi:Glutamate 5-kinase
VPEKAVLAHRSLLPVGIVSVSGNFDEGALVDVICGDSVIARGVADYGSEDIKKIRGMRSEDAKKALGGSMPHKDVVRSENLAILP